MRLVSQQKGVRPSKGTPWQPTGQAHPARDGRHVGRPEPGQTTAAYRIGYGIAPRRAAHLGFSDVIAKLEGAATRLTCSSAMARSTPTGPVARLHRQPSRPGRHRHRTPHAAVGRPAVRRTAERHPSRSAVDPAIRHVRRCGALVLDPATGRTVVDGDAYFIPSLTAPTPASTAPWCPRANTARTSSAVASSSIGRCTPRAASAPTAPRRRPTRCAPGANVPGGTFRLVLPDVRQPQGPLHQRTVRARRMNWPVTPRRVEHDRGSQAARGRGEALPDAEGEDEQPDEPEARRHRPTSRRTKSTE